MSITAPADRPADRPGVEGTARRFQHQAPFPLPWHTGLSQLMDSVWRMGQDGHTEPGAAVSETEEDFIVDLDLPGASRDDVTIDVTGRRLLVHATRSELDRSGLLRHSTRVPGKWDFVLTLPVPVNDEEVTASMGDGVLTVHLPKAGSARTTRVAVG